MFNAKDEEIRELLSENSELWLENFNIKMKIFNAIEYIKSQWLEYETKYIEMNYDEIDISIKEIKYLLEILGDKENEQK